MEYSYVNFLVVDGSVLTYRSLDREDEFMEVLYNLNGCSLGLDTIGVLNRSEIRNQDFMKSVNSGCLAFVTDTYLWNGETGEKRPVSIEVIDSRYLVDNLDRESGRAVVNWLMANADRYKMEYSDERVKDFCLVIDDEVACFDSFYDAFHEIKRGFVKDYRLAVPTGDILLKDTNMNMMYETRGYYGFEWNVVNNLSGEECRIAIIEMNRVFENYYKKCGKVVLDSFDKGTGKYRIIIGSEDRNLDRIVL